MKIALIDTEAGEIVRVYPSVPPEVDLPGMGQVSPAVVGWASDPPRYALLEVEEAAIAEGKRRVGDFAYAIDGDLVRESCTVEDIPVERRKVPKSVVTARLIAADKMAAAMQVLMADPDSFARWIAADQPAVYADDPAALALLEAIEADATAIMAPESD